MHQSHDTSIAPQSHHDNYIVACSGSQASLDREVI